MKKKWKFKFPLRINIIRKHDKAKFPISMEVARRKVTPQGTSFYDKQISVHGDNFKEVKKVFNKIDGDIKEEEAKENKIKWKKK